MAQNKTFSRISLVVLLIALLTISNYISNKDKRKAEKESFTFAFMTDIHVTKDRSGDKGFAMAVRDVNEKSPDFVITGGDLVMDALAADEEGAKELYNLYLGIADSLEMPVYNTIGNHEEFGIYEKSGVSTDDPLYSDGMYEALIGPRYRSFEHKGWRFYLLDAIDETDDRHYYGHIDSVQMAWLKEDLKTVSDSTPIVISTHIPLLTSYSQITKGGTAANSTGLVIENSRDVLDLFMEHNLKLVLQGHLHIVEEAYIGGIRFITGGAVCAKWWEGPRQGMEEGYMLISVKGEEIDWEYVDFGWDAVKE